MHYQGYRLSACLAEMLVGGVIVEVTNSDQAKLAETAGASGVMVVSGFSVDKKMNNTVGRMADPATIAEIQASVSIPVMAKCRIGHQIEAEILIELGIDYIDESESLTAVDAGRPVDKRAWSTPFIAGAKDLTSALHQVNRGAAIIRTIAHPGSGNIAAAVQVLKSIAEEARDLQDYSPAELPAIAAEMGVQEHLLLDVARRGRLPVVTMGAGGVVTPADAAMLRRVGADCIMVGSGIFNSAEPARRATAIVRAAAHYDDRELIASVSRGLGQEMSGHATCSETSCRLEEERRW